MDILDEQDKFLFRGRLAKFSVSELLIDRNPGTISLPILGPGSTIHIQGYDEQQIPFKMEAVVKSSSRFELIVSDQEAIACEYRRERFRQPVCCPAELYMFDDNRFRRPQPCRLLDISLDGARIESEYIYEPGTKVRLRVELYKNAGHISCVGEIIRIEPQETGRFQYGILFAELDKERKRFLETDLIVYARLLPNKGDRQK